MVLVGFSYDEIFLGAFLSYRKYFITKIYFAKNGFISLESILGGRKGKEQTKVDADFNRYFSKCWVKTSHYVL